MPTGTFRVLNLKVLLIAPYSKSLTGKSNLRVPPYLYEVTLISRQKQER